MTGGVQVFIHDEQRKLNARGFAYLHLSPLRAKLVVSDAPAQETRTRLVLNGEIVGVASDAEIADALRRIDGCYPDARAFAVHSPLGHSVEGLNAIQSALKSEKNFFWLHDYATICTGFNLLRNDVSYCGAPEVGSEGCRICIYGASRQNQLELCRRLFEHCAFYVASPSEIARDIWLKATQLPHRGALVIDHCHLRETDCLLAPQEPAEIGGASHRPVRIGFVGYTPIHSKSA